MANPHPQPHPENLKQFKKGDKGATEKQRKGGKASQEAQRRSRTMREWAKLLGELPMHPGGTKDPRTAENLVRGAEEPANLTMDGAVMAAMYGKAAKGDTRAASFIAQMKGQLTEEITVHTDPIDTLTEDQLDAIIQAIADRKAGQADD